MTMLITIVLVVLGTLVTLLASVGMIRFPDIFTRMHAASKPASLGLALLAVASALQIGETAATVKVVLVIAFVFLKVPVSAQSLARAAVIAREPLFAGENPPSQADKGEEAMRLGPFRESVTDH